MITSTGILSQGYLLRQLIAGSARFQFFTGTTTWQGAMSHVHYPEATDDEDGVALVTHTRPRAVVLTDGQWERRQVGRQSWTTTAGLQFRIELNIPDEEIQHGEQRVFHWADTEFGTIIDEMLDNSGNGQPDSSVAETYLSVQAVRRMEGPWINPPGEYELQDPDGPRVEAGLVWALFEVEVF